MSQYSHIACTPNQAEAQHGRRRCYPPRGIKGRRPAAQRPSAPPDGRFGDVILRAERRAGVLHKVRSTAQGRPPDGRALRG